MAETREEKYLAKISGEDVAIPAPITRKEKYLYNIAKKPGGGATTWDELEGKPFGEEQAFEPIVWDGEIDEKNMFALGDAAYIRISDTIPTMEQLTNATVVCFDGTYTIKINKEEVIEGAGIPCQLWAGLDVMDLPVLVVLDKDAVGEGFGVTPPGNGVYSPFFPEIGSFVLSITKSTTKTLDEKYMPLLTSPSGKKFKLTVDDSGTISATET